VFDVLQNPIVQIAVIVVGALALMIVVWLMFFSGGSQIPEGP
jgi:hypothetical protein